MVEATNIVYPTFFSYGLVDTYKFLHTTCLIFYVYHIAHD